VAAEEHHQQDHEEVDRQPAEQAESRESRPYGRPNVLLRWQITDSLQPL
jgi:hypothetical protein